MYISSVLFSYSPSSNVIIDPHNGLVRIQLFYMMVSNASLVEVISYGSWGTYMYVTWIISYQGSREYPGYAPLLKLRGFHKNMQKRCNYLFVTGRFLILDESLVRAFVRMKFKVIIITKSTHYGTKIYVLNEAENYYVLTYIV